METMRCDAVQPNCLQSTNESQPMGWGSRMRSRASRRRAGCVAFGGDVARGEARGWRNHSLRRCFGCLLLSEFRREGGGRGLGLDGITTGATGATARVGGTSAAGLTNGIFGNGKGLGRGAGSLGVDCFGHAIGADGAPGVALGRPGEGPVNADCGAACASRVGSTGASRLG